MQTHIIKKKIKNYTKSIKQVIITNLSLYKSWRLSIEAYHWLIHKMTFIYWDSHVIHV